MKKNIKKNSLLKSLLKFFVLTLTVVFVFSLVTVLKGPKGQSISNSSNIVVDDDNNNQNGDNNGGDDPGGDDNQGNEIQPTSAQYFYFSGNAVTRYIGEDTDIVIPRSYSLGPVIEQTKSYNNVDEWESDIVDKYYYKYADDEEYETLRIDDDLSITKSDLNNNKGDILKDDQGLETSPVDREKKIAEVRTKITKEYFADENNYPIKITLDGKTRTINDSEELLSYKEDMDSDEPIIVRSNVQTYIDGNDYSVTRVVGNSLGIISDTCVENVTVLDNITILGDYAFLNCTNLKSITFLGSVTTIGKSVFSGCSGLTSITIPNGVTTIGNNAFMNCSGLTSVSLPNSVTSVGDFAFKGCSSLTVAYLYFTSSSNKPSEVTHAWFFGTSFGLVLHYPSAVTSPSDSYGQYWNYYYTDILLDVVNDL